MRLLDRLEKRFGRHALPNVTIYVIAGQTFFYLLFMMGKADRSQIWLSADNLMQGEWWRLATLLFDPPACGPLCALFGWYFFYFMGSALEELWGAFRYNVFILTGFFLAVAASFAVLGYPVSNTFIGGSIFLAFAFLFPDYELLLFFILPVRIKWLALFTWLGYSYILLFGWWPSRLMVFPSLLCPRYLRKPEIRQKAYRRQGSPHDRTRRPTVPPLPGVRHHRQEPPKDGFPLLPQMC